MHIAVVEARTFAAQPTAVRRAVLRPAEVDDWLRATFGEIAESLRRRRIVPVGFPFSRRHRSAGGRVAVEAGFPLALPVITDRSMLACGLPAGPVAVTAHGGPYKEISATYGLIEDWLRRRDAQSLGNAWEIYHAPPIGSPDDWRTEIVQPYDD